MNDEQRWQYVHNKVEEAREKVRLLIPPDSRPDGLFQDLQDALYAIRGRPVGHWREVAAKHIEDRADLMTNSLHCGDSSSTIHSTHKRADELREVARMVRDL